MLTLVVSFKDAAESDVLDLADAVQYLARTGWELDAEVRVIDNGE